MTEDQNPWYSDPERTVVPPVVPDDRAFPTGSPPAPPSYPAAGPGPSPYPQQPPIGYQAYGQQPYGQPGHRPIAQTNGKATTSMVLGIVGLASIFICYGVLSIVLGPIAFFMGRSAEKEMQLAPTAWSNAGMAKAGWIMGLIQTILSVLALAAIAAFVFWFASFDDPNF